MSLPASQQRALDAIATDLRGADTRLARMFSVFTELTRLEKMPSAETFQPVRWWTRAGRRTARRQRGCTLPGCRRPGHQGLGWWWPGQAATGRPTSRLGTVVLVPLLLAATLSLLLLTVLTTRPTGSGRCAAATAVLAPVRLAAAGGCASGGQPRAGSAGG
jgi:hypothetical protein